MPYRYHYEIGIPRGLDLPRGVISLWPTRHCVEEARKDRYGPIEVPDHIDTRRARLVEVTTDDEHRVKAALYRVSYDKDRDLCIVVSFPDRMVKTVWSNLKTDTHTTLRRELYAVPV